MSTSTDKPFTPVREDDPDGSEFYMYPAEPPAGDWSYVIDDYNLRYRSGFWPFSRGGVQAERREISRYAASQKRRERPFHFGEGCGWSSVRLAPEPGICSAGQNYISVRPDHHVAWRATATLTLYVRPQGLGAIVVQCEAVIDLRDFSYELRRIRGTWPDELVDQAHEKSRRAVELLRVHVDRRDAGKRKVETAHNRRAR